MRRLRLRLKRRSTLINTLNAKSERIDTLLDTCMLQRREIGRLTAERRDILKAWEEAKHELSQARYQMDQAREALG